MSTFTWNRSTGATITIVLMTLGCLGTMCLGYPGCDLPSSSRGSQSGQVEAKRSSDGSDHPLSSQRRELKAGDFTFFSNNIVSFGEDLIRNLTAPDNEDDVWSMAIWREKQLLFFILSDRVWRVRLTDTNGEPRESTLVAGPWPDWRNDTTALALALEDRRGAEGASAAKSSFSLTLPRNILHVSDCSNKALRAFSIDNLLEGNSAAIELFVHNYSELTGGRCLYSLAIDSPRQVMYASSGRAIYRMNLTYPRRQYAALERWVGPYSGDDAVSSFEDSEDPLKVRFGDAVLSSSAIPADGQVMYVADAENNVIRRISTAIGAVKTVAGKGRRHTQDGAALDAGFFSPIGLALTPDGCNLLVSERAGALRLIGVNPRGGGGGGALNVTTIARTDPPQGGWWALLACACSPDGDMVYIGRSGGQITGLRINKSALPSCSMDSQDSPPPGTPSPSFSSPSDSAPNANPSRPSSAVFSNPLVAGLAGSLLAVFFVGVCIVFLWRRMRHGARKQPTELFPPPDSMDSERLRTTQTALSSSGCREGSGGAASLGPVLTSPAVTLKTYSLQQMAEACHNFSATCLVGTGGAAEVYRGVLATGQVVAIKMMKGDHFSQARFRQFQAELSVLGTLRHSHLCSISGYGAEGDRSFIVYPFVEGGTLHERLHSDGRPTLQGQGIDSAAAAAGTCAERLPLPRQSPLTWQARLSIAWQIAKALRYLHEEVDPPVIHRDVKSKNVLLETRREGDNGMSVRAYLSDFGLAKLGQSAFSDTQTARDTVETYHVAGTIGYIAPEYYTSCRLTLKNDVYAFGVLLLELITGRKAFGSMEPANLKRGQEGKEEEVQLKREDVEPEGPLLLEAWAKRQLRSMEFVSSSSEEETTSRAGEDGTTWTTGRIARRTVSSSTKWRQIDRVREIADPRLEREGEVDWSQVRSTLQFAMECVRTNPEKRPHMGEVMERLPQGDRKSRRPGKRKELVKG